MKLIIDEQVILNEAITNQIELETNYLCDIKGDRDARFAEISETVDRIIALAISQYKMLIEVDKKELNKRENEIKNNRN